MAKSRFVFPGKYAMRKYEEDGSLLAFFRVVDTELGLQFSSMKLFKGKNGVFVTGPSREYKNREKETKYENYIQAAYDNDEKVWDENGTAWFEELANAAYELYESLEDTDEDEEEEEVKPRKSKGRGAPPTVGSNKPASRSKAPF